MHRVLLTATLALGLLGSAAAQSLPWHSLPATGPQLDAFVYPAGIASDDVGLVLLCTHGAFAPMLRLGPVAALLGATNVWVESVQSDTLGAGSDWAFDPVLNRAVPIDERHAIVIAQALTAGGTLRVRVSRARGDPTPAIYNFGLDGFQGRLNEVPCLRASAAPSRIDHWSWNSTNEAVVGGDVDGVAVFLYCLGPNSPTMAIRFAAPIDPLLSFLSVFIARGTTDAAFRFDRTAEGVYVGDANSFVRTLVHLTQDGPFLLVLAGAPAAFATLALGNFVDVLGMLPCVTVEDRR